MNGTIRINIGQVSVAIVRARQLLQISFILLACNLDQHKTCRYTARWPLRHAAITTGKYHK